MKYRWFAGAWAFVGAPAVIVLIGYLEQVLFKGVPKSVAFLIVGAFLPGVCIGLGLLALLSLVKSRWSRAISASAYGCVMYVLTEAVANPVLQTHAVLVSMPQ